MIFILKLVKIENKQLKKQEVMIIKWLLGSLRIKILQGESYDFKNNNFIDVLTSLMNTLRLLFQGYNCYEQSYYTYYVQSVLTT